MTLYQAVQDSGTFFDKPTNSTQALSGESTKLSESICNLNEERFFELIGG